MAKNYNHSKLHNSLRDAFLSVLCRISPKTAISLIFRRVLNKKMDWNDHKDFNEKVNWLKIYGDSDMWARLTTRFGLGFVIYLIPTIVTILFLGD